MSILLLVARLLLAVVFLVSGLAKIVDLRGSQKAVKGFGVPSFLATPLGTILPFAELAVAIALVPTASALYGAIGAAFLLVVFIVGISANLSVGRQPDCHCFGQLHSEPIGASTLIRNVILAVVAGFVIWQGAAYSNVGVSAVNWITTLTAFQAVAVVVGVILVALVAVETWLLLQTMTQQGRLLVRLELLEENGVGGSNGESNPGIGLPEDSPAPEFELPDLDGNMVSLTSILAQTGDTKKAAFLVFTSPTCGPCQAMMPNYVEWQEKYADKLTLVMITQGTVEENRAKVAGYGVTHLLLQQDKEVADSFKVRGTPSGVAISYDGGTYGKLAEGEDNIKALLQEFTADVEPKLPNPLLEVNKPNNGMAFPVPPKIGEAAPDLTLLDIDDNMIKLSDFRGTPTLLLFWNPGCTFCQGLLQDLLIWEKEQERKPVKGTPKLLVISIGGTKMDNHIGFKSTVVLDDTASSYSAARWFKAGGTPMAILLDENGIVSSKLAEGANEVMELAKPLRNKAKVATV
ncbi:MAG: MauE/DoxX family redox-associated membrane protein [Ktedonobacteraceae bacterium]